MKKIIKSNNILSFSVGDVIITTEKVWNKDSRSFIKKGKTVTIKTMDDIILLPQPHKWKKYEHS